MPRHIKKLSIKISCLECGKLVFKKQTLHKFCSGICGGNYYRRLKLEEMKGGENEKRK